jgi:hypothetical protein
MALGWRHLTAVEMRLSVIKLVMKIEKEKERWC